MQQKNDASEKRILAEARGILILQVGIIIFITVAPWFENGKFDFSLIPFQFYKMFGVFLNFSGFILFVASVLVMRSNFEVRAQQRESCQLIVRGPFVWTRNPIYVAALLMSFGWAFSFLSSSAGLASLVLVFVLQKKIKIEEHFLTEQFGEDYKRYMQRTPRWFLR